MNYRIWFRHRPRRAPLYLRGLLLAAALCHGSIAFSGEIHTAVQQGDLAKVASILATNSDLISSQDARGSTPLYFAASRGDKAMTELLLANHADVNAVNQYFTPLRAALLNHHQDVADLLIASNALVNIFDAAAGGYLEIVKAQLKASPGLVSATDDSGWTPLHFAARNGQKDVAQWLLANHADPNLKTTIGMTPLQTAFAFSSSGGSSPGQAGGMAGNYEAIVQMLIASGADVTGRNNAGMTALHYAAASGSTNFVKLLLEAKADINARDNNNRTPLDRAMDGSHRDVMELLLAHGAEMNDGEKAGLQALKDSEKKILTSSPSSAREYEIDGVLKQTTTQFNNNSPESSASFTIYVRDCGWLIQTVETNEHGAVIHREIGSTNGTETYECAGSPGGISLETAQIEPTTVPVGQLDNAVTGHLWLMFASQCYWPTLHSDQIVPVYDWHASVVTGGEGHRVTADWELLPGSQPLPREVRFLNAVNKTNAIYTITGTTNVNGIPVPAGFVFQEFNGDRVRKRVEVQVTAVRPVCSRPSLIPLPKGRAIIIDLRLGGLSPRHPPSYRNPVIGQWPTLEEAKVLVGVTESNTVRVLNRAGVQFIPLAPLIPQQLPEDTSPPILTLSIRCTNDVVKAGDEIPIEFRIANRGSNDYRYADRTYDRSGRIPEYMLAVTNDSGGALPDPRAKNVAFMGGGLFGYKLLKPGESYTKVIPLNRWALVKVGGEYQVTAAYQAAWGANNSLVSSEPLHLTVQPRSPEEMDAYVGDLTNQLEAKLTGKANPVENQSRPPDTAINDLVMKLMYTCSPKIVPILLKSAADYGSGGGFWEREAIEYYVPRSDETKQLILVAAKTQGLAGNYTLESLLRDYNFSTAELKPVIERALADDNQAAWPEGAQLAEKFGDDAFVPRLIVIAKTPRNTAQSAAIRALAAHRTDAGVAALKSLLDDPHGDIWTALADALMNGVRDRTLRPGDFTAQDIKPLAERMLNNEGRSIPAITGISLVENFGSDDFTLQLIAFASDPSQVEWRTAVYALAENRTNEGVKTLRTLLDSPDARVRQVTEDAIRSAYLSHDDSPGRPLLPGDFDKEYQQPKPKNSADHIIL